MEETGLLNQNLKVFFLGSSCNIFSGIMPIATCQCFTCKSLNLVGTNSKRNFLTVVKSVCRFSMLCYAHPAMRTRKVALEYCFCLERYCDMTYIRRTERLHVQLYRFVRDSASSAVIESCSTDGSSLRQCYAKYTATIGNASCESNYWPVISFLERALYLKEVKIPKC